jgi:hypothetical protein
MRLTVLWGIKGGLTGFIPPLVVWGSIASQQKGAG